MAIINEIDYDAFNEWLSEKPEVIKELAKKVPPGRLFLYKPTNVRVFPYSYEEDGTLTVVVSGEYNQVIFERRVFGVSPDDLEECDPLDESEQVGAILTEREQVDAYIDILRERND